MADAGPPASGDQGLGSTVPPPPPRPAFSSSLPDVVPLDRPRHVVVGAVLVALAVAAHLYVTAMGALRFGELRDTLLAEVDGEIEEFSKGDIERAVNVLIGVAGGLGLLLLLFLVTSYRSLMARRTSGRTGFIGITVFYLPVAVVGAVVRLGGRVDEVLTVTSMVLLLATVLLVVRRPVSDWLHQVMRKPRVPLNTTALTAPVDDDQDRLDPADGPRTPALEPGAADGDDEQGPRSLEERPSRRRRWGRRHRDDDPVPDAGDEPTPDADPQPGVPRLEQGRPDRDA